MSATTNNQENKEKVSNKYKAQRWLNMSELQDCASDKNDDGRNF